MTETMCRRQEPRFKTFDEQALLCETAVEQQEAVQGAVIDISPSGLRLLCEGNFKVGQTFCTELKTDQSYGTFKGVIRRVEPWMGGNSLLGCQLLDKIPCDLLEALAQEHVVNRRQDDRVDWNQPAKISWELQPGEVDIKIQDCSPGGLKVASPQPLPNDLRLRIRVENDGAEETIVDARSVWQLQEKGETVAGLTFTKKELPEAITKILREDEWATDDQAAIRPSILVASAVILLGVALLRFVW